MSDKLKEAKELISELEETMQQLDAEIQRIGERKDEIFCLMETWSRERSILYERRDFLTSAEEIQNIDERITDIERQLDRWEQEQNELLEHCDQLISEKEMHFNNLKKMKQIRDPAHMVIVTGIAKSAAKKAAFAPVKMAAQTVRGGLKSGVKKINPFDKKINKNDVTDSGVETIRLAYTSVKKSKKSIKTVSSTVKTTHRTIKTAEKAAQTTVKLAYKTPIFIVKTAVKAVRITATVAANIVAVLINPVVIIIIAILLLFLFLILGISVILFGGDTADKSAATGAVGLVKVDEQYQKALDYFNAAVQSQKDAYYALIDSLYYNYPDDLTHSDLAYLERTDASGNKTTYQTSFATDERKDTLKAAWDFTEDDVRGIIAVAYVYLEKQENEAHGTEGGIYEVTYTQEVFDMLAEQCVNFTDTIYSGQTCGTGCTRHVEIHHNPAHDEAVSNYTHLMNAYNEWCGIADLITYHDTIRDGAAQAAYWDNNVQWRIDNWKLVYFDSCYYSNGGWDYADDVYSWYSDSYDYMLTVPEEIEEVTYICEYQHNLHSIGLWYYSKESIMDALNFTANEKEWVNLTEMGFESNPNIP